MEQINSLVVLIYLFLTRYYNNQWINDVKGYVAPHKDVEIFEERNKCLKGFFLDIDDRKKVNVESGLFSGIMSYDDDSMEER